MSTITLFHGGPLSTEFFDGHTFWTWKASQAIGYMDGDTDLWAIELDKNAEEFANEVDYLPENGYADAEDDEANWDIQSQAIRAAVADGATVVMCDDGWVIVDVERLNPCQVTQDEANKMECA